MYMDTLLAVRISIQCCLVSKMFDMILSSFSTLQLEKLKNNKSNIVTFTELLTQVTGCILNILVLIK